MTPTELLSEIDRILEDSKTGLMTTLDAQGRPCPRWMTPRRIKGRPGCLYTVSESHAGKLEQVRRDPRVTWLIQEPSLNVVITLHGRAEVLEEPPLLQEFLEAVGKDLFMVWHLHPAQEHPHLVVVETVLEEASRFDSRSGKTLAFALGA
jgi:general stress protein 26